MPTRILGGRGNRGRRSQKTSCRAPTLRRPSSRYERSRTRKANLCIIQVLTVLAGACGYTLLMLTFSYWESANGPRFVFPCTALLLVLAAALLDRIMHPRGSQSASD